MRRVLSLMLCLALALPSALLPWYAFADEQEDASRAPDDGGSYYGEGLAEGCDGLGGDRSLGEGPDNAGILRDEAAQEAPSSPGVFLVDDLVNPGSRVRLPPDFEASSYLADSLAADVASYLTDKGISLYSASSGSWAGGSPSIGGFSGTVSGLSGAATNLLGAAYGGRNHIPTITGLDDYQSMVFGIGRLVARTAVEIDAVYDRLEDVRYSLASALQTVQLNQSTIGGKIDSASSAITSSLGNLVTSSSLMGSPDGRRSVATVTAYVANALRTSQPLSGYDDNVRSAATLLALIHNQQVSSLTMSGVSAGRYSIAAIAALTHNQVYGVGQRLGNLTTDSSLMGVPDTTRSVATVTAYVANALRTSQPMDGVTDGVHSVGTISALIYNQARGISAKLDGLSVDVGFPTLDAVTAKLDGIMDLMRLGLAVDVADAILGDLDFSALSALTADVSGALSSAFPFCVPAILHQVLGLVQADGVPPIVDFDLWGAPLRLDFSDFRGLGDVTGWVCRVAFAVVLLANTRRFVFAGGAGIGGGSS